MTRDARRRLLTRFARAAWSDGQVTAAMDFEHDIGGLSKVTERTQGIIAALNGVGWSIDRIASNMGMNRRAVRNIIDLHNGQMLRDEAQRRAA